MFSKFWGVLFLLVCTSTEATTVVYQDFNQLVDNSHHVVTGLVKSVKPIRNKNGSIYTIISLEDAQTVESNGEVPVGKNVKLRFKGGAMEVMDDSRNVVGTEYQLAAGTPKFSEGEKIIVFVSHNGKADMPIYGWTQGVFRINGGREILNAHYQPIVGFSGSHLITKSEDKLWVKGEPYKEGVVKQNASDKAAIIDSDGGKDRLIERTGLSAGGGSVVPRDTLTKVATPMDLTNFLSAIQERKAAKNLEDRKTYDVKSLVHLPAITSESRRDSRPSNSNTKDPKLSDKQSSQSKISAINKDPTIPIEKPRSKTDGQPVNQ